MNMNEMKMKKMKLHRNDMHIMFVLYYVYIMLNFMCLFITLLVIIMRHELWCNVGYMR